MTCWRIVAACVLVSICSSAIRDAAANAQLLGFTVSGSDPLAASAQAAPSYDYIFKNGFETPCSEDADHDGLSDCVETNTRVYVSATNTGTDPHNPDTDGDGLLDGEEVQGTSGGLNLPGMGVNPLHKDILIEYDWFDDNNGSCFAHSHRPHASTAQALHDFYASAPILNPDGTQGINLIQDYGQGGLFAGGNKIIDASNPNALIEENIQSTQYQAYEAVNFAANRHGYFHYMLMAHKFPTTSHSGIATPGGSEAITTLACFADDNKIDGNLTGLAYIRNTIAHELGHNLGLQHGGDNSCNDKPNYNSVMNYRYQFTGADVGCNGLGDTTLTFKFGYSRGDRLTLDEDHLNEAQGMCTGTAVPIDWNGNGSYETAIAANINIFNNRFGQVVYDFELQDCGGLFTILRDYNDWGNLKLASVSPSFQGFGASRQTATTSPICGPIPNYSNKP